MDSKEVLNIIQESIGRKRKTFGHGFQSAYHTIKLGDEIFEGQRDVYKRLCNINYDFKNKIVFDVGCNIGGMLHALSSEIKYGVGIDYNSNAIKAAIAIKDFNKVKNLSFYTFDLENEDLQAVKSMPMMDEIDVSMVFSIALWVKNWKEVVVLCRDLSPCLLYESHGSYDFQEAQYDFLKSIYSSVDIVSEKSQDDNRKSEGYDSRKTFICER